MCCARLPNRSVDVAREHQQSTYGALTPDDVSDRGKYIVVVDHDARGCGGGQPTPDLHRHNTVRVDPYAHPQHIKVLKH